MGIDWRTGRTNLEDVIANVVDLNSRHIFVATDFGVEHIFETLRCRNQNDFVSINDLILDSAENSINTVAAMNNMLLSEISLQLPEHDVAQFRIIYEFQINA